MQDILKQLQINFKKTNKFFILFIIFLTASINIVINSLIKIKPQGDWLGFWGGILGSVVGIGGIYWQFHKQRLEMEKKENTGVLSFFLEELIKLRDSNEDFRKKCLKFSQFNTTRILGDDKYDSFIFGSISKDLIPDMLKKATPLEEYSDLLKIMNFHMDLEMHFRRVFMSQNQRRELLDRIYNKSLEEATLLDPNFISNKKEKFDRLYKTLNKEKLKNHDELRKNINIMNSLFYSLIYVENLKEEARELTLFKSYDELTLRFISPEKGLNHQLEEINALIKKMDGLKKTYK